MSSTVFFAQAFGLLNTGGIVNIYKEAIQVGRDINLKTEEFEFLLDAVFGAPPVLRKTEKIMAPAIMIATGKCAVEKTKKENNAWSSFRKQNSFTRRLTKALDEVLIEDPIEDDRALQKAWENSRAKDIEVPSSRLEQPSAVLLQPGVSGLWGYSDSSIWAPKQSEVATVFEDRINADCLLKEAEKPSFDDRELDSPTSTEAYNEIPPNDPYDPYYNIFWDNFVNYFVNLCLYTLDHNPSFYVTHSTIYTY